MTLSPKVAAQFASAVYGVRTSKTVREALVLQDEIELLNSGLCDFSAAKLVNGDSGAGVRSSSGFTMVVPMQPAGARGDYVVATRGTVTGYDWLTDFASALEPGPAGCPVHAGFNRTAQSVSREVMAAFKGKNPGKIHVVGHSLGGAVSNLLAVALAQVADIELYTFGAPRAGMNEFSHLLHHTVGDDMVKRVYSLSDPVPMVPIHPFLHAPTSHAGAVCGSTSGFIWHTAHFMTSYKPAVENKDWAGMHDAARVTPMSTEDLLKQLGNNVNIPGLSGGLNLLGRTLGAIMRSTGRLVGMNVTGSLTAIDRISLMLSQGAKESPEIDDQLKRFMVYALLWAGLPVTAGSVVTIAFMNYALGLMLRPLVGEAKIGVLQGQARR